VARRLAEPGRGQAGLGWLPCPASPRQAAERRLPSSEPTRVADGHGRAPGQPVRRARPPASLAGVGPRLVRASASSCRAARQSWPGIASTSGSPSPAAGAWLAWLPPTMAKQQAKQRSPSGSPSPGRGRAGPAFGLPVPARQAAGHGQPAGQAAKPKRAVRTSGRCRGASPVKSGQAGPNLASEGAKPKSEAWGRLAALASSEALRRGRHSVGGAI
jgi:hypothetical protein